MKPSNRSISVVILALLFQFSPHAQAAPNVVFNGLMSGCDIVYSGDAIYANRLFSSVTTTITGINIKVGTGLNSNWSTTKYWIVSHNSLTGKPGVVLETFTANSTSGSGASTLVNFTGSVTLTAGTKFYVYPNVSYYVFPVCYSNAPPAANLLPNAGINVDTSTTLTNASWAKAFIAGSWPGANSTNWSVNNNQAQLWALSLESGASAPVNVSLALVGGGRNATFRTSQSITATVDTPSYVTFYNNGKKIAGCISVLSSAGSASCAWKPSNKGAVKLTARAKPISGSYDENTSGNLNVLVSPRTSTR